MIVIIINNHNNKITIIIINRYYARRGKEINFGMANGFFNMEDGEDSILERFPHLRGIAFSVDPDREDGVEHQRGGITQVHVSAHLYRCVQ